MYLSKLEIFGFKSFAQKTSVKFNDGVTSIVGPNGCGKTNIVDAIRWCLGEQRTSTLRSDKMENVIFNGTTSRKPMGMAEVSLTIENTKGILPTEYTDVTITRRIFRSGDSEYLLNKNLCRLKDITNLFMDTGIGANAYSVIELKMVETILSNKAEERRVLFEEAAGVNKYKLRRRLALRKLEEVKSDLTRVNDIVVEVTKKVESLERQAKRSERYNRLYSSLKELELELAEREFALFTEKIEELKRNKEKNLEKKTVFDSELEKLSVQLQGIKLQLEDAEKDLKERRNNLALQTEKIYKLKNEISIYEERKRSVESNLEKYNAEIEELEKRINSASINIEETKKKITIVSGEIESGKSRQEELKNRIIQTAGLLEEKKLKVKMQSEQIVNRFKALSDKENKLSNVSKALDEKNNQIASHNDKILQLTGDVAKTVGFIESLNEEKETVAKKLSRAEERYSKMVLEKERLEKELNRIRTNEVELKTLITGLNEKILFIQNLVDNLEGISKGTKSLIEFSGWAKSDIALLASSGTCPEEVRLAVEAALRNNVNDILVSSIEDLKHGIDHLKKNDLGRASFYLLNDLEKPSKGLIEKLHNYLIKRGKNKIQKEDGFVNWAAEVIRSDNKWNKYFKKLLNNTAIVKDFHSAERLSYNYPGFSFTTLYGDFLSSEGIIESGSSPQFDQSLFGKKQMLDDLKAELPAKQNELEKLSSAIIEIEEKINRIDLKVLSDEGKMLVNDLANIDKQISQFEFEKQRANDEIEKHHQQVKEFASDANKFDNEKNQLSEELDQLLKEKSTADAELKTLEEDNLRIENEHNSFITKENELKLELERKLGEHRNLENVISQTSLNVEAIKNSVLSRKNDIQSANDEINKLVKNIDVRDSELKQLDREKNLIIEGLEEKEKKYVILRAHASEIEDEQNKIRKEKDSVLDLNRDLDIKLSELEIKKTNLIEHINEEYSLQLALKKFDDLHPFQPETTNLPVYDFHQKREEVHELRQKIKNLGPINLLAYAEFEEEKKRMDFLTQQRDDLVESEKDIVKTIEEINHTAHQIFIETFEKIRENFIGVFRTLFDPGDEVDLRLEEDADPLEAKIEIIAKPKGKRPTSIELLSGGEKTLTAIALLFAIYLVKPSPFCILDEIDAPLDDANIDRFTRLLKDFSKETQFIVVTHNKRTMESAETLYGVTMQEEGISKLVSVRFNEDIKVEV